MPNVVMSEEFAAEVARTVRKVLRQEHSTRSHSGRWQGSNRSSSNVRWAITLYDFPLLENSRHIQRSVELLEIIDTNLQRTGDTVTVTQRWDGIELEPDTLIRIINENDEWVLVGAACEPMEVPPT